MAAELPTLVSTPDVTLNNAWIVPTTCVCTQPYVVPFCCLGDTTRLIVRDLPVELPPSPLAGDGASAPKQACVDGSPPRQKTKEVKHAGRAGGKENPRHLGLEPKWRRNCPPLFRHRM